MSADIDLKVPGAAAMIPWIVGRSQNLISHHLSTLRAEGLATGRRDGKMIMFSLTASGETLTNAVVDEVPA